MNLWSGWCWSTNSLFKQRLQAFDYKPRLTTSLLTHLAALNQCKKKFMTRQTFNIFKLCTTISPEKHITSEFFSMAKPSWRFAVQVLFARSWYCCTYEIGGQYTFSMYRYIFKTIPGFLAKVFKAQALVFRSTGRYCRVCEQNSPKRPRPQHCSLIHLRNSKLLIRLPWSCVATVIILTPVPKSFCTINHTYSAESINVADTPCPSKKSSKPSKNAKYS